MKALILFSYPVVVQLSVYLDHAVWAAYYLALLFALPLPYYLFQKRRPHWLAIFAAFYSVLILWLASNQGETLLFAQPVIINSLLFLLFVSTLIGDSVPIISRLTIIIKPGASDEVLNYCRGVTWAWAILFFVLAVMSWIFSVYAPIEVWSLFTNVMTYILVALMFVAEYFVRRILMKDHIDRSFIQFVRDLRKIDYQKVAQDWWL